MAFRDRCVLALLAVLVAVPPGYAAKRCSDTSGFDAAMEAVDAAVPCASATSHKKYVKNAKKALGRQLSGACRKQFVQRFLAKSTCGRSGFVVCCSANRKGKDTSNVVKASRCRGSVCSESNPTSVGEGCTSGGTCVTTTTTTTTTAPSTTIPTASPTSTTTTTTLPPSFLLDFGVTAAGGPCGEVRDGTGTVLKTLTCGGLNIGGGTSTVAEGPTPDGSVNRYALSGCNGSSCTVSQTGAVPPLNSPDPDCTDTGCKFGTPLPIPNQATPALSVCVLNTYSAPASGTIDLATGVASLNVALRSETYLTGNVAQPCPRCSATGSPGSPGTGTCDRGPRAGQTCVTTNSQGLTRDCLPGGSDATHPCTPGGVTECIDGSFIGPIAVDLSPLTTGTTTSSNPGGLFCPGQTNDQVGCFGTQACRSLSETGTPAGPITPGTPASVTLASTFCIAATGSGLVDISANLPGPGAVSLPAQFLLTAVVTSTTAPTSSTIATTTTTTAPTSTSIATTTTTPGSTTTTIAPPNTLDFINGAAGGNCGETRDASNVVIKTLDCGKLYLGGGKAAVPPNTTPDGATTRFALSCTGDSCTLAATSTAPALNSADVDCTDTGCFFGTPLPIPSAAATCVVNTFSAPASGTLNLATGVASETIVLNSATYLSGNMTQPCPQCSATGSPSSPGTGTCNRGPRAGQACTTTNSQGLTRDCPPGASPPGFPQGETLVGNLGVNLSPLTTSSSTKTDPAGNFCPGQPGASTGHSGCFADATCRTITETGTPAGPLTIGTPAPVTLASVFCVPKANNVLIDQVADLPGPGATALPGTFVRH